MKFSTVAAILNFAILATAAPPFDPAGDKNVGNGAGGQFIGGQCLSDADCGSACCANPTGICSGPGAQFQNGKTGCGFGSSGAVAGVSSAAVAQSTTAASTTPANGGPAFDPSGAKNVGNGAGLQFIGGQCLSTADCGSGCCAGPSGICSGPGASTQNGKTGCGFPGTGSVAAVSSAAPLPTTAASTTPANGGPAFDPSGAKNVGNGAGLQFIGGQCLSTADCGSGCCAGPSGICSGPGASTQNGKTGCGFPGTGSALASSAAPLATTAASTTPANGGPAFDPSGVKNVGNGAGIQFIGGQCLSTADCASGCCAGPSGICSGPGASTQNGKTGCGFSSTAKRALFFEF